jgi:hypothetical protein
VEHATALGLLADDVLRLLLRADEEDGLAAGDGGADEVVGGVEEGDVFWRSRM